MKKANVEKRIVVHTRDGGRLNVRINDWSSELIQRHADLIGISVSDFARAALTHYIGYIEGMGGIDGGREERQ